VKSLSRILIVAVALACAAGCQKQKPQGQVVARVNQSVLTDQDFYDMLPPGVDITSLSPADKEEAVKQWVRTELQYQQALKAGLDKDPKIARLLREWPKIILVNELEKREINGNQTVTEQEAKTYYEKHEQEYQTEVKISEILLPTLEEAKAVKAALDNGADFAKLAREKSLDKNARQNGGEINAYMLRGSGDIDLDLEEKIFALPKGGVTEPIKIANVYHVIKVTDSRPALQSVKFDAIKDALIGRLTIVKQREVLEKMINDLQGSAKIESHPELLK
jgi:parvulin-like peptidyl-prolyl isomerase